MKKLMCTILMSFATLPVWAMDYRCKEHKNFLVLKEQGFEHVNHTLSLNGKMAIKEFNDAMWFVEKITCTSTGFKIEASHRQYNDPTTRIFLLNVTDLDGYKIE